jgi:hypothetical protein
MTVYKRPPTLQVEGTRSIPHCNTVLLQYQPTGRMIITSKEGPELG